jgi:methionine synthase I (cobalamin-dependent)
VKLTDAGLETVLVFEDGSGGCCGTDIRHVSAICDAWLTAVVAT